MKILDRIFKMEEMNGSEVCPTYLYRWTLFKFRKSLSIYLHHFIRDDWAKDHHDHPKRFISIGLKGGYIEETPKGTTVYRAPWIRSFPAEHIHSLKMIRPGLGCWTIAIVFRVVRPWGFWKDGQFVGWREYVKPGVSRPACD